MGSADNDRATNPPVGAWTVFLVFLRLGLTSFGGPIAHLGYFRDEFVTRRHWLGERSYADLVALCQFLPGPASSQVGMAIGLSRAGFPGALAAWAGFTLPSAIALILFAIGVATIRRPSLVNSLCPSQLSRRAICRLTAPWVTPSSAAASA